MNCLPIEINNFSSTKIQGIEACTCKCLVLSLPQSNQKYLTSIYIDNFFKILSKHLGWPIYPVYKTMHLMNFVGFVYINIMHSCAFNAADLLPEFDTLVAFAECFY